MMLPLPPLFLLCLTLFFSSAHAGSPTRTTVRTLVATDSSVKHNTIIIYSGHNTIPSHVRIREGWQERLAKSKPENEKIEIYEEYLDDIRLHIENDFDEPFIRLWHKKYANIKLDMVVSVGPAADNLLNRHPELFAGVPYYALSVAGLNKDNQGIGSNTFKILNVVAQTLPDTERLVVLSTDKGNTYYQNLIERANRVKPLLPQKMKVEFWDNLSFDEIYEQTKQLPEKTALLYFPIATDCLGERNIPFEVLKKLVQIAPVPIFVHDDTYLKLGVVGGYVRNLKQEGDIIGRLVLGLGTPKNDEEYNAEVRGYFFNDNALKRWHILDENLPPSSIVLNRPESIFYVYRWYIAMLFAMLVEATLIVMLIRSLRRGKKMTLELANERNLLEVRVAERTSELEESRILFQDAANVAKLGVFDFDLVTNELHWDDSMFVIYGMDAKTCKSVSHALRKVVLPEDMDKIKSTLTSAIERDVEFDTRFRIQRPSDGKIRTIHALGQIYRDANGKPLRVVGINQDITEREEAEAIIRNLAYYDPLTQLANRRLLAERLKQAMSRCRRENRKLAVMMMDLDKFKAVNDTLGHAAGDELLIQVAERIKARLREHDTVARLGGDEFVVIVADIHCPQDAARVANSLIETLTQPFVLTQSDKVQIGTSIGITFYPQHGDDCEALIDKADAALYQAKHNGRGCFAYFVDDNATQPSGFNVEFCADCDTNERVI